MFYHEASPCPFCGSVAAFIHDSNYSEELQVECDDCDAKGPKCATAKEALDRWDKMSEANKIEISVEDDDGWILLGLPFDGWSSDGHRLDSFKSRGLAKVGTLIKMENGDEWLIGDINENRGLCDCCVEFAEDDIVAAYKVVYQKSREVDNTEQSE